MKKQLVATLAAAVVLGVSGTSLAAAANPFVDVPAKHWAYESVAKLAQAGIVDGYGDGTYKGDKVISRYEMAQVVAKAMARSDKADAKQKAMIEKLAVEFASELNNLGVRMAKLEKNQPNFKITGTMDMRFTNKDYTIAQNKTNNAEFRFRLNGTAQVDENTTVGIRFVNNTPDQAGGGFDIGTNNSWTRAGNDRGLVDFKADRFFLTTKVGEFNTTVGRQMLAIGNTGAIIDAGLASYDGIKLATKSGKFDVTVNYGRLPGPAADKGQKDVISLETGTAFGKLSTNAGYFNIKDHSGAATVNTNLPGNEVLKLYYMNAKYMFTNKLSLQTELGTNEAKYAVSDNRFYTVWATIGDQVPSKKGENNIQVRYYYSGKFALADDGKGFGINTFSESVAFGPDATTYTANSVKSTQFFYNYAFSNGLNGQIGYYIAKSAGFTGGDYKLLRTVLTAKF